MAPAESGPTQLDQVIYHHIDGKGVALVASSLGQEDKQLWDDRLLPRVSSEGFPYASLCYLRFPDERKAALIYRSIHQAPTRKSSFAHVLIGSIDDLTATRALASLGWCWPGALTEKDVSAAQHAKDEGASASRYAKERIEPRVYTGWADARWLDLLDDLKPTATAESPGSADHDGSGSHGSGDATAQPGEQGFAVFTDESKELAVRVLAQMVVRLGSPAFIGSGFTTYEKRYVGETGLPRFVFATQQPQISTFGQDRTVIRLRSPEHGTPSDEMSYLADQLIKRSHLALPVAAGAEMPDQHAPATQPSEPGPDSTTEGRGQTQHGTAGPEQEPQDEDHVFGEQPARDDGQASGGERQDPAEQELVRPRTTWPASLDHPNEQRPVQRDSAQPTLTASGNLSAIGSALLVFHLPSYLHRNAGIPIPEVTADLLRRARTSGDVDLPEARRHLFACAFHADQLPMLYDRTRDQGGEAQVEALYEALVDFAFADCPPQRVPAELEGKLMDVFANGVMNKLVAAKIAARVWPEGKAPRRLVSSAGRSRLQSLGIEIAAEPLPRQGITDTSPDSAYVMASWLMAMFAIIFVFVAVALIVGGIA